MNKIKKFRRAGGMSQSELAERLGICPSYMCEIETGRKFASFKTLYKLSQIFGCDMQELLDDQTSRRQKKLEAEEVIDSMETEAIEEIREERRQTGEAMLFDIMTGLQALEFASRKKVLTYVNDLRRAESN